MIFWLPPPQPCWSLFYALFAFLVLFFNKIKAQMIEKCQKYTNFLQNLFKNISKCIQIHLWLLNIQQKLKSWFYSRKTENLGCFRVFWAILGNSWRKKEAPMTQKCHKIEKKILTWQVLPKVFPNQFSSPHGHSRHQNKIYIGKRCNTGQVTNIYSTFFLIYIYIYIYIYLSVQMICRCLYIYIYIYIYLFSTFLNTLLEIQLFIFFPYLIIII